VDAAFQAVADLGDDEQVTLEIRGKVPDRVSFVAALRISRRSIAQQGAFPPQARDTIGRLWLHAIGEPIGRLLPRRRPRANPRVAKRKYTKWHVKRSRHRGWPQPNRPLEAAMVIYSNGIGVSSVMTSVS